MPKQKRLPKSTSSRKALPPTAHTASESRIIGIRHALKRLKGHDLVEEDTYYPDDAVDDIQSLIAEVGRRWYLIGARRGAKIILAEALAGRLAIEASAAGVDIEATRGRIPWPQSEIRVRCGREKRAVSMKSSFLELVELGFTKSSSRRFVMSNTKASSRK